MGYIKIITAFCDKVKLAVDATFDATWGKWIFSRDALAAIKNIDHAEPIKDFCLFSTPYGCARPEDLSSGVKSILLIMYRLQHPEEDWIPSMDSMGPNAKEYVLNYLLSKMDDNTDIVFPLYCTVDDFPDSCTKYRFLDANNNVKTLSEIIEDS